jgi:hypothetical protein
MKPHVTAVTTGGGTKKRIHFLLENRHGAKYYDDHYGNFLFLRQYFLTILSLNHHVSSTADSSWRNLPGK